MSEKSGWLLLAEDLEKMWEEEKRKEESKVNIE